MMLPLAEHLAFTPYPERVAIIDYYNEEAKLNTELKTKITNGHFALLSEELMYNYLKKSFYLVSKLDIL